MRGGLAAVVALLIVLASSPAAAYFEDDSPFTDHSAYTMNKRDWRIGIWDAGFSPLDWLQIDTYIWPWFAKMSNLSVKFRVWKEDPWAVGFRAGLSVLDLQDLKSDAEPVKFRIFPLEISGSRKFSKRFLAHASLLYTGMVIEGSSEDAELEGAVGSSNTQLLLGIELRLGKRWALLVRSRHLLHMQASASAGQTMHPDEYTTIEVEGGGGAEDIAGLEFPKVHSVVPSLAYSGKTFHLLFGLGYGNFNIPGINFIIPYKTVVPEFDMYWQF